MRYLNKSVWFLTVFIISCLSFNTFSQSVTLPFESSLRIEYERNFLINSKQWHPVYPLRIEINEPSDIYSDITYRFKTRDSITHANGNEKKLHRWIGKKLFYESLILVDKSGFKLQIDPMVSFEYGNLVNVVDEDNAEDQIKKRTELIKSTWLNTRGFQINGSIGKQFSFHSVFFESQAVFPTWVDEKAASLRVVPGQGMYKGFKNGGYDFAFAEGHISYSPSKYFNFRFGHGKNFIGDGYRSLLLSDAAFSYPYLAINTRVWNIEYVNIFSQHQDISYPKLNSWQPWQKKYSTTHYLSWNVLPWLQVGAFETIIWQAVDSSGQRGFDINYLNPVIFYRPVEFSLGSPDNAMMGGNIRFTILKKNILYFQFLLDEFKLEHVLKGDGWWANKHGFQAGMKAYDLFNIPRLYFQAEYNHVRPYTYAHNVSLQNYGHYNQSLAHPQGANFREIALIANKRHLRWEIGYKFIYSVYGADMSGDSYGHDIYRSYYDYVNEYGNKIGQGLKTRLMQNDINFSYIINPSVNLRAIAGITLRKESNDQEVDDNVFVWFGLRSAVFNRYYDF